MHRYGSADRWPEARDIDRTIPTRPIVRRQQSPTTALAFVLAAEAQDPRRPFVKAQEGKKLFTLRRQEATQATEVILFGNSHRVSQEVPKVLPETSWSHWVGARMYCIHQEFSKKGPWTITTSSMEPLAYTGPEAPSASTVALQIPNSGCLPAH